MKDWNESEHPRDGDGKFTDKGGSVGMKPTEQAKQISDRVRQETIFKADKLSSIVAKFRKGEDIPKQIEVSKVSSRESERLSHLIGAKITATTHVIEIDEIRHIEKRHGEHGIADSSMSNVTEYDKIIDVIQNFDKIDFCYRNGDIRTSHKYKNSDGTNAKLVQYIKIEKDHSRTVVEAICDNKSKTLKIITCYSKFINGQKNKGD